MTLIECVPNVSEGRCAEVVDEICAAIAAVDGVSLLDRQSDAVHNRSVLTFAGQHGAVAEGAFRCVEAAVRLIDLTRHEGAHPRMGAADVVPFVPLKGDDMSVCVEVAHAVGARVARDLGVPVYFYEEAARSEERRDLAAVREGQFEGLREAVAVDPSRAPDEGAPALHPTAGATAVGARAPLIAYNINLASRDLELAQEIARAIRERDGGLPKVKALGLALEDCVQVSMNLTDYRVTSMQDAFAAVQVRALQRGVAIRESEVVGLVPLDALVGLTRATLKANGFTAGHVLEARLLDTLL